MVDESTAVCHRVGTAQICESTRKLCEMKTASHLTYTHVVCGYDGLHPTQALLLLFVASAMSGSHGDSGENTRGGASRRGRRRQTSSFASTPVTPNPEQDVIPIGEQHRRGSLMRVGGRASTTRLTRESLRAERVSAMDQ